MDGMGQGMNEMATMAPDDDERGDRWRVTELGVAELGGLARVSRAWIEARCRDGLVQRLDETLHDPAGWRFSTVTVRRVRRMAVLERDWDAAPELAALVTDLEDEIARLRGELDTLRRA